LKRAVELDPRNWEARTDLAEFLFSRPHSIVRRRPGQSRRPSRGAAPAQSRDGATGFLARIAGKIKTTTKPSASTGQLSKPVTERHRHGWHLAQFLAHANRLDETEQALRTMESSPVDRPGFVDGRRQPPAAHGPRPCPGSATLRRYLSSPAEEGPAFKAHDFLGQLLEKQGDRRAAAEQYRAALPSFTPTLGSGRLEAGRTLNLTWIAGRPPRLVIFKNVGIFSSWYFRPSDIKISLASNCFMKSFPKIARKKTV